MAGLTKMPFKTFIASRLGSIVPYAIIAAYAGSISTFEDPDPAIYAAIGLTSLLWFGWWLFNRIYSNTAKVISKQAKL